VEVVDAQQVGRCGLVGCAAGDAERDFAAVVARLLADDLTLDQEDLADMGEVEVVVEPAGAPDAARLDAAMLCG